MENLFYELFNLGMKYNCDRCKVCTLRDDEWSNNRNIRGVYCDECWCYIHLQKGTHANGNTFTIRSERKIDV